MMGLLLQIPTPADSLAQMAAELNLGPLQEPDPVKFSFETAGWPILGGILCVIILIVLLIQIRKYYRNRYRREALADLENVLSGKTDFSEGFVILKRTAIIAFGREKTGNLYGEAWFQFVDTSAKNVKISPFQNTIEDALYREIPPEKAESKEILLNIQKWIRTHDSR